MSERHVSAMEWYQTGRLAPYMVALRDTRVVGASEALMPAGDMSAPPTSDLVLVRTLGRPFSARGNFGAGRFEQTVPADSLFLMPAGVACQIEVHDAHHIQCFAFPAARFGQALAAARRSQDPLDFGRLHRSPFQAPRVLVTLDALWRIAEAPHGAARLALEAQAYECLSLLCALADRRAAPGSAPSCDWRVRRALEYIDDHLAEDIGLAELCAAVDLTAAHFTQLFRKAVGMPPHRWLMQRRIERACALLADPRLSITDIAFVCGFASSQHLATSFRRLKGATPSEYRRESLS